MEQSWNPETTQELHSALNRLLVRAYENDVSIPNAYDLTNDDSEIPHWEIQIYRVQDSSSVCSTASENCH